MKHLLRMAVVSVVVLVLTSCGIQDLLDAKDRKKREIGYQAIAKSYSERLKPGLTRREVEAYLKANGTQFTQRCYGGGDTACFDFVQIGHERVPWFCSDHFVEIQFSFSGRSWLSTAGTDILRSIGVHYHLDGCL